MSRFIFLHGKRGEYFVVLQFVVIFAFILTPVWNPLATPWVLDALEPLRWGGLVVFGLIAMLFGGLGSANLREYLTPLPYPVDHSQLIQHGIYAYVRHPLYSSLLFSALAWTFYSLSLTHLLVLVIAALFFDNKAAKEEGWLIERHPEYVQYAQRVKKFVPWIY